MGELGRKFREHMVLRGFAAATKLENVRSPADRLSAAP
jgi:hypothetical protein